MINPWKKKCPNTTKLECQIQRYKRYGRKKTLVIQIVYLIGALFWIGLLVLFKLSFTDFWGYLILSIPLFVFGLSFYFVRNLTVEVEENVLSSNYLSIGLLIVLPLLTGVSQKRHVSSRLLVRILLIAIVLALISLLDFWVSPKWISLPRHVKSILSTMSLTLLVFALYVYYRDLPDCLSSVSLTSFNI